MLWRSLRQGARPPHRQMAAVRQAPRHLPPPLPAARRASPPAQAQRRGAGVPGGAGRARLSPPLRTVLAHWWPFPRAMARQLPPLPPLPRHWRQRVRRAVRPPLPGRPAQWPALCQAPVLALPPSGHRGILRRPFGAALLIGARLRRRGFPGGFLPRSRSIGGRIPPCRVPLGAWGGAAVPGRGRPHPQARVVWRPRPPRRAARA